MPATPFVAEAATRLLARCPEAPSQARRFLVDQFQEWGIADHFDGCLVVSELVTNACKHGLGVIVLRLNLDEADGSAIVEVWDQGPDQPQVRPASHTALSGRGLHMVEQLTEAWGTRPITEGGKVVWCRLAA